MLRQTIASILVLGVTTQEKGESKIIGIFKGIFFELDKVGKDLGIAMD